MQKSLYNHVMPSVFKWQLRLTASWILVAPHDTPGHPSLHICHFSGPLLGGLGTPACANALFQLYTMVVQACLYTNHFPEPPHHSADMCVCTMLFPNTDMRQGKYACLNAYCAPNSPHGGLRSHVFTPLVSPKQQLMAFESLLKILSCPCSSRWPCGHARLQACCVLVPPHDCLYPCCFQAQA